MEKQIKELLDALILANKLIIRAALIDEKGHKDHVKIMKTIATYKENVNG